jgi:hypothetical protein
MKGRTIKSIVIAITMLSFFSLVSFQLFPVINEVIAADAYDLFFWRSGFGKTYFSRSAGHWYEMEAALCVERDGFLFGPRGKAEVKGFSFDIHFDPALSIEVDGRSFEIRDAEFDLFVEVSVIEDSSGDAVTTRKIIAMEVKSGTHPESYAGQYLDQAFCQKVICRWAGEMSTLFNGGGYILRQEFHRKTCPKLAINTEGKTQRVWSTSIEEEDEGSFVEQWDMWIRRLAYAEHMIVFKHEVPEDFKTKFTEMGHTIYDLVDLDQGPARA